MIDFTVDCFLFPESPQSQARHYKTLYIQKPQYTKPGTILTRKMCHSFWIWNSKQGELSLTPTR